MTETALLPVAFALGGQKIEILPISVIKITPRQRKIDPNSKEWKAHIGGLAASIKRSGLLHPITLEDESNELVAGFCRIQAFLQLGLDSIPAVRRSNLTSLDKKLMELEENLQRQGLEWWMRESALADIHRLQTEIAELRGETWTQAKTAEMAQVSVGAVNAAVQVTEAIKSNPELKNVSGLVAALNAIKTTKQLEQRKVDIAAKNEGKIKTFPARIEVGDALALIRQQPDAEFDAVVTNFPFGIELTIGKSGDKPYKDDEDYIVKLVQAVTHQCYRVLKPDSWMLAFFDVRKITYSNKQREFTLASLDVFNNLLKHGAMTVNAHIELTTLAFESLGLTYWMEEAGFDYVQLLPCIWAKPNKRQGMIGDPNKGMIMGYEAFVLAGKGSPILMKKGLPNLFIHDTLESGERDMSVQMPSEFCAQLVSLVCLGGGKVLDPFAGSGAVGVGALRNQCSFLGFELDPERAEVGNLLLQEELHAKPSA